MAVLRTGQSLSSVLLSYPTHPQTSSGHLVVDIWHTLFSSSSFIPHGHCYLWKSELVWLHVASDGLIALAYYSIPLTLLYFVNKRQDLPFHWIFLLFSSFIVACGTTHLMEVWTLWHPIYWFSGILKASTATVSLMTAVTLIPIVPRALALPSPEQLKQANQELQDQMRERQRVEAELKQYQTKLEQLVEERTAQLADSNRQTEELLRREQEARSQAESATVEIQYYAEQLTLAMDAARMGSWNWNLLTNKMVWTPYQEMIFGYPPGQPDRSFTDWFDRIHPEDMAGVKQALTSSMMKGHDFDCEYRLIWPDGTLHWVDTFGRFTYDAEGNPLRMAGVVLDITSRQLAAESLRQSEEMARQQLLEIEAIYSTAPIGLCVLDREFRYVRINEFLAAINGVSVENHLGRTVRDVLAELGEIQEQYLHQVVQSGEPILNVEVHGTIPSAPEVERDWLVSYYPLQNANQQVSGINVTTLEITDRKVAEQALQERAKELSHVNAILAQTMALLKERNRELDQFAYVVSHDLKAPLRAIANLSEWIEEDLNGQLPEDTQRHLDLMRKRVYRMEALINGLLAYSRVGRIETPIESVQVEELLMEVIDSLAPPPTVTIEIASTMPTLKTRRLLLGQVFSNLISNSVKHRDRPDGRITIAVQDRGNSYEFSVSDDGPGIAPLYHEKVFTIFQTLKSRDEQENTGVGLSIVKKIVETEGGSIHLDSQVGAGTTFRFTWLKQARYYTNHSTKS